MFQKRRIVYPLTLLLVGGTVFGLIGTRPEATGQVPSAAGPTEASTHRAVLDRYCVTRHNQRLRTSGLALDTLDLDHITANAAVWEKVIRKVRAGAMPPAGV